MDRVQTGLKLPVVGAIHTSGSLQSYSGSALHEANWYFDTFLPKMKNYHKGPIVYERSKIKKDADAAGRQWAVVNGSVYDLTDYFYTVRFRPLFSFVASRFDS